MGEVFNRLAGKRVLIVEDEWLIADDLTRALIELGAHVVGPAASASRALDLIKVGCIDAAILDIHLGFDGDVYAVAEALQRHSVPFMFATGYDDRNVRPDFAQVPHLMKPYELGSVGKTLSEATAGRAAL